MKKIVVMLMVLSAALITGLYGQFEKADEAGPVASDQSTPVNTVETFWARSSRGHPVEDQIIDTPVSYFDDRKRCIEGKDANYEPTIVATIGGSDRERTRASVNKSASSIISDQLTKKNARVFRQWKDEAIVEVGYSKLNEKNIERKWYFFLKKQDEEWGIFARYSILLATNPEFALCDSESSK